MILRDNMGWWSGDGPGKVFTMTCIILFEWLWMVLYDLYVVCFEPFQQTGCWNPSNSIWFTTTIVFVYMHPLKGLFAF